MPIIAKEGGSDFTPAPSGVWQAVCCDVIDLGMVKVEYAGVAKEQHKIRVVWQVEENDEQGAPFRVQRRYTLSIHQKAALRKDLESWRGRAFTPDELKGFDVEKLIGANCLLNVVQESREGRTYANVSAIMPLRKGTAKMEPTNYVRVKDRDPKVAQPSPFDQEITDDDIPF